MILPQVSSEMQPVQLACGKEGPSDSLFVLECFKNFGCVVIDLLGYTMR